MRRRKKKRRLKKWVRILLLLIVIFLIILLFIPSNKKKSTNKNTVKISINKILEKIDDNNIDKEFLDWYQNNYDINKLDNYLKKNKYNKDIWHKLSGKSLIVLKDLQRDSYKDMDNIKIIDTKNDVTFSFVGDVSLADNWYIMPKYDSRKKKVFGILDKDVVDIMTSSDVMVVNNEFTISDKEGKRLDKTYTFKGSPKRLSIYKEMGVDLVTLANNHVYDFGSSVFNDMLSSLREYKIPYIGAGENIDEASRPYYYIANGYKVGLVNATRAEKNIKTPGATDKDEGVFRCYDNELLIKTIKNMKSESDYVILLIHWGKEDSHDLEDIQIKTAKEYIDAGVDVIVGSHAHELQGFEFYNNKFISYNLGDFIFNNETKDTGILQVNLDNSGNLSYKFIPCKEKDEYTSLPVDDNRLRVLDLMKKWSRGNLDINDDGYIKNNS